MVESLAYTYTSELEMQRLFSVEGITYRIDDVEDPTLTIEDIIGESTEIINFYVNTFYEELDLSNSYLVRRWATWIACYLLSQRRGNSSQFESKYTEILEFLDAISQGNRIIPRLASREDFTPAMSNLHVDDRFKVHKLRVHPTISTGGSSGKTQDLSPRFPFEWL